MSVSENGRATVAIIGAGEMGSAVGRRLRASGARVITEVQGRSEQSAQRVIKAGLEVIADDDRLVREADFVLSIVPPGVACEVAGRFRGPLSRTPRSPVFVECNAISPATARHIEGLLADTECGFVDAGIVGGPPPFNDTSKGPRFYASGPHAHRFAHLTHYGLEVAVLNAGVGGASALKLAYAGLTKGFTALGAAMITAVTREGLADELRAELARTQPDMLVRLERFIPSMFPKAYRWVAEMKQIAEYAGTESDGAGIYQGAARLYEQLAAEFDRTDPGERLSALTRFCKRGD
jgi:L-threonate 2-dehydrogenase